MFSYRAFFSMMLTSLCCGVNFVSFGQGVLMHPTNGIPFVQNDLPSIYIECGSALDSLYEESNWYSNLEYPATFIFDSENGTDTVSNVGFRLRGNTSRAADKKSFKVSFNAFIPGGSWQGLEKLNLNGEHNDPSIIRARLIWEGMRDSGIQVSRSNHVNLYINGFYHGVYHNLEHIDEEWLEKRFALDHGNLWKCTYPANLVFMGTSGADYKFTPDWSDERVYDLKTNKETDDYEALAQFIDILNNEPLSTFPCALESVFDVYAYLKTAAAEILCGHWDNYIGNQNNFYLYHRPEDQRIVYIPYDVDNTLGIQWFGEWSNQDPYAWTQSPDRPLYSRLLSVPEYRLAFTFFMRQLMESTYELDWLQPRGEVIQSLLLNSVEQDPFYTQDYGFNLESFSGSLNENWGEHVAWGILPFMESRQFWAEQQLDEETDSVPHALMAWAPSPVLDDTLLVLAWTPTLWTNSTYSLQAEVKIEETPVVTFPLTEMETNAFGIQWAAKIPLNNGTHATWNVISEFQESIVQSPCTPRQVWNTPQASFLVINEVMPLNNSALQDASGGFPDWVELMNTGESAMNISDYYLTDRIDWPNRWELPNVTLDPGQHLVLFCDNDPEEGPLHAPFHLDAEEGDLWITTLDTDAWRLVDYASWTDASPNASWGRTTDGSESWMWFFPFTETPPTPNSSNGSSGNNISDSLQDQHAWHPINPCPAGQPLRLPCISQWQLFEGNGKLIGSNTSGQIPGALLQTGAYLLRIDAEKTTQPRAFTLIIQ